MKYERKTRDEYTLQAYYLGEWETIATGTKSQLPSLKAMARKLYPTEKLKIVKKRVLKQ